MVIAELARNGITARKTSSLELVDDQGQEFWLGNLRDHLATVPPKQWRTQVEEWVRTVARSIEEHPDDGDVLPRVFDLTQGYGGETASQEVSDSGYRLTPNLVVLPAFDTPTSVIMDFGIERLGGWDSIMATALANLRALPMPNLAEESPLRGPVWVFEGDLFTASRILILDDLLRKALGDDGDAPLGVVVAIPSSDVLAVHIVGSGPPELAVQILLTVSRWNVAKPLSRHVYYRGTDGVFRQVSVINPDGVAQVFATGPFREALEAAAAAAAAADSDDSDDSDGAERGRDHSGSFGEDLEAENTLTAFVEAVRGGDHQGALAIYRDRPDLEDDFISEVCALVPNPPDVNALQKVNAKSPQLMATVVALAEILRGSGSIAALRTLATAAYVTGSHELFEDVSSQMGQWVYQLERLANDDLQRGEVAKGLDLLRRIVTNSTRSLTAYNNLAHALCFIEPLPDDAAELLQICEAQGRHNPFIFHNTACVWVRLGDHAHALEAIRGAVRHGYPHLEQLRADTDLEPLFGLPEFAAAFDGAR